MKAKAPLYLPVLILVLILGLAAGCSKNPLGSSRSDAQIASDVQNKLFSDPNVQSRQISVQSANGVVTIAGNVNSEAERAAAANDAAQVEGVKTVVNNLQVQTASATPPPMAEQEQAESTPPPAATQPRRSSRPAATRATTTRGSASRVRDYSEEASGGGIGSSSGSSMAPSTPAAPVARKVTIPDGTTLSVRLIDAVDSEVNQPGDTFRGTLNAPIVVDDDVVVPAGADVQGRVVDVKSAGRFAGQSTLAIELIKLEVNGRGYQLQTDQWSKSGSSRGKATAAKVGGGAAVGALIGGLAGGGKGAAIGATIGAGAGTGVSAATKGQQIRLGSEALLTFRLESPLTVTAVSQLNRNRGE